MSEKARRNVIQGDTSIADWLREWQQVRSTEHPCGIDGHDFAVGAPTRSPGGQRIYDLICARCGEYREVRSA